ncbi:MAG: hypothetical protein ACRDP9_17360 [Kribbellaceae bacterium]
MNDPMMKGDDTRGLTALLQRAVDDEPPSGFSAAEQVRRGRRARRRRTALASVSAVAAVAVVALVAVAVRGLADGATDATAGTPAPTTGSAGPSELTKDTVAATIEDALGVTFRTVKVQERMKMPSGQPALDLYGAIADPAGDTVFVFGMVGVDDGPTTPPTGEETARTLPNCKASDFTVGTRPPQSAYVGTCHSQTLSNGAVVIWRSGHAPGGYARSAAMLGRPDGSEVFVESTNQAIVDPRTCVENGTGKHCPVGAIVRPDPGVTAQALGDLLVSLEPLTR